MPHLVSVIVPMFNGARYVSAALQSVLAQTHQPLEVIVVDDGSSDNSAVIAGSFGSAARYVWQANQGAGAARNRGVGLATGDYLAFLDQDDLWCADKVECQLEALMMDPGLEAVFGLVQQFSSPDALEPTRQKLYCPALPVPGYIPSTLLIRRESFIRIGPFATQWRVGEWADWYVRSIEAGLLSLMLPRTVAQRRLHDANQGMAERSSAQEYARILRSHLAWRRTRGVA